MASTHGVAFFAFNTNQIDYIRLAILAARYVKRHMPTQQLCIITDVPTYDWHISISGEELISEVFDDIVLVDTDKSVNKREHYDSPWTKFISDFKNSNKHKVIEYTPYDKTLLLDIDYIIQNNNLEYVFDTDDAVTLYHEAEGIDGYAPALPQTYLSEAGIPMLWSTVVYFDKHNELTKLFFDVWAHVADHYDFYQFLYRFPEGMYRTDFCVSIAVHILNGMGAGELIESFPGKMINMSQFDDIGKINAIDDWVYVINNHKENWKDSLTRVCGENVHVMNKRALDRAHNTIVEMMEEEDK